jgi:OTU domain-containing protein 7
MVIVNKARESVLNDIVETSEDEQYFVDTPEYTFILPDLTKFMEDFRAFLQKDLIETATLVSLEQAGTLCNQFQNGLLWFNCRWLNTEIILAIK